MTDLNNQKNNFNYRINSSILELSKNILGDEGLKEIEGITKQLLLEELREKTIQILQEKIGVHPKRPIYYLNLELRFLPDETRGLAIYAGSYIDSLIRHFAHEKNLIAQIFPGLPLGRNLKLLKNFLNKELYESLLKFNELFYIPAKHNNEFTADLHLFSAKEVIAALFIMQKLSKIIISLSEEAKVYSEK